MKLLAKHFFLRLLFLLPFYAFAQTYTTEFGSELKHAGSGWYLLGKKDGDYLLKYRNDFKRLNYKWELVKEIEMPFELLFKEGYKKSEIFLIDESVLRVDLFYNKKKKCYVLSGTNIETPGKGSIDLITYPVKDESLFALTSFKNDDKSFSTYAYYANESKMTTFQFKMFDSTFKVLNEWTFELPYKASTVTFPDKTAKHFVTEVYYTGNRKVCLIVDEDLGGSGQPKRRQLVAYIHDLLTHTTDTVVIKNISVESSVKMIHDADRVYVFSEIHNRKEFVGISTVVLNTQNNGKEVDKEILFTESDKAKIVFGAKDSVINKKMVPVKMHITSTGNIFVLYESSYMYNIGYYGPPSAVPGMPPNQFYDKSLQYVYGDIVVFSLSNEGMLKQIYKIPKAQRASEKYRFGSFYSLVYKDELYVFLNDFSDKYIGKTIKPDQAALVLPEKGSFMGINIAENGEMTWKEICKTVIQKDFVIPSEDIIRLDENRVLIPASDNRDINTTKQKLVFLSIEN